MSDNMIRMAAARQSAHLIQHLLSRFIPDACRRDAIEELIEALFKEGYELTSIHDRLQMEEIRNSILKGLRTPLTTTFVPHTAEDK